MMIDETNSERESARAGVSPREREWARLSGSERLSRSVSAWVGVWACEWECERVSGSVSVWVVLSGNEHTYVWEWVRMCAGVCENIGRRMTKSLLFAKHYFDTVFMKVLELHHAMLLCISVLQTNPSIMVEGDRKASFAGAISMLIKFIILLRYLKIRGHAFCT